MIRVLLVEDDPALGRTMARGLSRHVDVVDVVADVGSALQRIEHDAVDVVVTDYQLAGETGLDLFRVAHETHPALRFVLVSGSVDKDLQARALAEGVRACFDKPVAIADLVAAIRASMDRIG